MSYRNDTNRNYQSDAKLFKEKTFNGDSSMKQQFQFCFKFFAFVFSHVGLGFLVLVYTIFGAFLFKHFEEPSILERNVLIANIRNNTVDRLWIETYKLNVLYKENWTAMAIKEIEHFQRVLIDAFKDGYWPIEENGLYSRWSFIDSWMYSISIITTIGYANRPLTTEGKLSTMLYALLGIPIMLLFLSTIGNLLGRGLKLLYNFCCTCSSDHSNSFINLQSSHDHLHHLHDNYQVHHIALNNISNNDGGGHLMSTCNIPSLNMNNITACNKQNKPNYTPLNSIHTYPYDNRACSCEIDQQEAKLSVEPIDHICTDKFQSYSDHAHNCNCTNEASLFYKDLKIHPSVFDDTNVRENVPFYFCFFLITLYIIGGSIMFHIWEGLSFLDGAYFCFVTLSTIGFGDILPEKTISLNQAESKKRIIIIVLYILGGMTLVAMSFNIIYEQLAFKFKKIGYEIQLQNERNMNNDSSIQNADGSDGKDSKIVNQKFHSNEDIDV